MQQIIVKVNNASQVVTQAQVVTKSGQPTIIKANGNANYEFVKETSGKAPDHIVTKRVGKDLHVSFEEMGQESDLIVENFYDYQESALIGQAESGEYHYYIPDTGEVVDYVTQLHPGAVEGQALGGDSLLGPWWMTAMPAGVGGGVSSLPWLLGSLGAVGAVAKQQSKDEPNDPVADIVITSIATNNVVENNERGTEVPITGVVTGDFTAGDVVTIRIGKNSRDYKDYTTTVDADGNFTVNVPADELVEDGDKFVEASVKATSEMGNSYPSDKKSYGVDPLGAPSIAPAIKIALDVAPDDEYINSAEKGTATTTDVEVGVPADAKNGDVITVTDKTGTVIATYVVGKDGVVPNSTQIIKDIPLPAEGESLEFTASITNATGVIKSATDKTTLDSTPPEVTELEVSEDGTTITGKTEPNLPVEVTLPDGTKLPTVADKDGNFTVTPPAPVKPNDTVQAVATDPAGNPSQPKDAQRDNEAPTVDVTVVFIPEQGIAKEGDLMARSEGKDPEGEPVTYSITPNSDPEGFYAIDPQTGDVTLTDKGAKHVNNGDDLPPINVTVTDPHGLKGTDEEAVAPTTDLPKVEIVITSVATDDVVQLDELNAEVPVTGEVTGDFSENDPVIVTVNGVDYETTVDSMGHFSVNVPANELAKDTDGKIEATINARSPKGVSSASATHDFVVELPEVSLTGDDKVDEGQSATYTVSLNKAFAKDVTVAIEVEHIDTVTGDIVVTTQAVTVPAGNTQVKFGIDAVADSTTEGVEVYRVVMKDPQNATLGANNVATEIQDTSINGLPSVEVTITATPTQGEAKAGDEIATSKGTDPEGEPVTYTITDGSDPEGFYAIDPVTGTVTLTPKGADHVNNGNDLPPVSVTVTDPQGETGTDANNTVPATVDLPVVSISGADRVEEGKDATYTVSLDKAASKDVTVTVTITHGTTDAGDLVTTTQEVTIKAGTTEATFNVTAVADNTTEGDENFSVVISAPVNATLGTTSTDTTVVDASTTPAPNQAPTVEVTITATPTQGEAKAGDEIATSKGTDPEGEPVTYTITDGSDPEGFYAIDPVTGTVTLTPKGADHVNNGNDLPPVSVTVTDPQGETGTDANNTVPATVDLPVVSISGADRVEEGKDATYTVSLDKAASKDVTVTVTITHGTTDAGDLVTTTQEVTIKAGTTEATFNVTAVADNTTEGDENFSVVISAPVNATLGTTSTDTTVVDASTTPAPNQAPTVEVTITATPTQGEAKAGDEIATSKGTDPEGEPVTYTITDGSDPEGFYAIDPVTGTVTLTPKGADHVNNGNDLPPVSVTVTDPQGETGTDANNTVPATVDLPVVSISGADRVEEGKDATYTVSLDKAASKDVTVTVTITHGTTDAGDLVTTTQEVTIKAGTTEATFNVTAVADNTTEGDENFSVVISAPVNATLGTTSTDTTVVDASTTPAPNQAPTVEVTITATPTQGEAKAGDEIATSKGTDPEGEPVTYTITDGSDPEGFYAIDPVTGTVTLTPKGADHVNNGNDLPPVSVTVTDPQGETGTDANNTVPATVDLPVVSISGADRVEEGKDATYTVSLDKAASKDVTVTVTITHGTTDAGDLVTTTQEVTIKAGTTEATFNVTAVADNTTEGDENFSVVISAPVNATLGTTSTDTTVVDASTTPAPNQAPTVEVTITATPTQGEAKAGDEIATSKGTDPEGEPVTYTITDGSDPEGFYAIDPVTGTVTLTPKGADHVNNGNDLPPVSVTVTDPQGETGTDANNTVPATVDLPVVSISGADRVEEGKDATYTVSLDKAASKDVTVTVTITHGTTDAGDLVTTTQEVTIKAGTTEATFNVTAVADNTTEGDENFSVVISAPVNATLGTTSTDTTVVDASTTPAPNQAPTVEVTITATPTQGEAKAGDEIATSKGTDPEGEPVTYTITDGSDPEGFYAIDPVTGTVTLTPKGADHVNNGNDLPPVSVTVTDPQGETGTDANNTVPATVDLPVVSISGADRVEEGKDATYTVSLDKAASKDVTVTVTITHGTTDAGDLVTTTQEVTIKAGTTEATFNVTAVADNTTEGDENFSVVISAPVNATLGTTSTDTTVVDASTTPAPNQAPTVEVTITATPTQGEAKAGDEIATSKGTDPEGEPVTYTITDGSDPEGFYAIDPVTGTVTLTPKGADHVNNGNDLPPVSVTVTDPQGETGTDANNTVPATVDLPVVSISGADRVEEGKDATYTVSLDKAASKDVTVTVTITHGTTDAGDLVTTTQEVTIKAGTTEATFNVTAVADNTTEGDENFSVVISAPVNATLGTTSTDTTVVDASTTPAPNQAPTVEVTITATPTQGEAKAGDEIATSKGTDPEGEPVTYTITDGSDPEGFYAIDPVTGTVTLTPKGADHVNNGNDLPPVSVTVTDPQGETGTDANNTVPATVDLPVVSISGADRVEEGKDATYTVSLDKAASKDVTVTVTITHGTTDAGDLVTTTQEVTIKAGTTEATFNVTAVADNTTEGDENFSVVISAPVNATLGTTSTDTTVVDASTTPAPNQAPTVEVTITATPTQGEAKAGDEIATSKGTDPEGEPVTYTITDGSDPEGFYAIDPVTGTVTLTPKGADHVNNGNDLPPVSVTVTDPQGETGTDANNTVPATVDLPVVSISGADRVEEGKDATYTVSLDKAASKDVTVTVTITHGTTDAGDLVTTTQEVTIKAGTTEATFNVTAVADNTTEGDENFSVVISAPVNATLGTTSTDTTVVDASTTPAPNQAPTVEVTITATPTQGEAKAGDEIATSKGTDPEGEPVTYTITDGSDPEGFYAIDPVTGTVTLTPKGADHVNNGNDLPPVSVTVTDPQGETGTDANNTVPATVDLPVVSISGADRVEEGKDATYTVSLDKAASKDVTVTVTITHGTTDAGDLVTTTQEVTIKAGTTEATFNVTAVADNTTEGDENFSVVISAPVNATLGTTSTDTTVVDASTTPAPNQAPTVEVTITATPTQGEAKAGDEIATSKGTDPEGEPVTYTITDGSDPEGFYAIDPVTGTVTLTPKGADHVNNGNDLPPVSVTVTDPQGETGTDANNTVPATVDLPVVSISGADRVEEGKDATYTVSLDKAASKDVTVTVTITHGTTDAGDLVTTTQEVTIKAGTTEATFNVTAVADNTTEGDENFSVVISAPVNATLGTTSTDTTVVDASTTPAPNQAPTVEVTITATPTQGEAKAGDEIATSKGTDPEGEPVTYTITDGSDPEGFYAIDPVTGTVTLTPKGADHVNNGNDLPPVSVTVTDPQGETGTDANNTVPATVDLPVVSISGADRVEEGKDATYTVSLDKAASKDVTVTVTITHGTTDAGDLVTTTQEVTIKAGTTEATFNVTAVADNTTEGDENFSVVISAPVNATLGTTSTDTTVVDASTTPAPQTAPVVTILKDADNNGYINAEEKGSDATTDVSVLIPADARNGDVVTVVDGNNVELGKYVVGQNGVTAGSTQIIKNVALPKEGETLSVKTAISNLGGKLEGNTDKAIIDTIAPDANNLNINIISIAGEDNVLNLSEVGVTDKVIPVVGQVTGDFLPGNYVTVHVNGKYETVTVDEKGMFTAYFTGVDLNADADRVVEATILARDKAGNLTKKTDTEVFTVEQPAVAPVIDSTTGAGNTIYVSEEGLRNGIADTTGQPDTTNNNIVTGQFVFRDPDSTNLSVSLEGVTPIQTLAGKVVAWQWNAGTNTLQGVADGEQVVSINVNQPVATTEAGKFASNYTVTLHKPVLHPVHGIEDVLNLDFKLKVSDGKNTTTSDLRVVVEDDMPSIAKDATVDIVLQKAPVQTNLLVGFDLSGSMTVKLNGVSRLDSAKKALQDVIDKYDDSSNEVAIKFVTFGTSATVRGSTWMTVAEAKQLMNSFVADAGATNYDDVLSKMMTAFEHPGKLTGSNVQNVSVFLTDGEPNYGNGDDNSLTGVSSRNEPLLSAAEEKIWTDWLNANNIKSHAYVSHSSFDPALLKAVNPVAYDGTTGTNTDGIHDQDPAVLAQSMASNVSFMRVESATGTGNVFIEEDGITGKLQAGFGADGGYVSKVVIGGQTYTFDGANTITTPTGKVSGSSVTITTPQGGKLVLDMATAVYHYTSANGKDAYQEQMTYTVVDRDGDGVESKQTWNVVVKDANGNISLNGKATLEVIDDGALGLNAEYYGYNDSKVVGNKVHADDAKFGNLQTISDMEGIINGRNGKDVVGTNIATDQGTADARFTATSINYGNIDTRSLGTNIDVAAGGDASVLNTANSALYQFLSQSTNADKDSIVSEAGIGKTTDAAIRVTGNVYFEAGHYDFRVYSDDGFRLLLDGQSVIEFNNNRAPSYSTKNGVYIEGGLLPVELLYWEQGQRGELKFEYKSSTSNEWKILDLSDTLMLRDNALDLNMLQDIVQVGGEWNIRTGDVIEGGSHKETITGSDAKDLIYGGGNNDTLTGGNGGDFFVYNAKSGNGNDVITDFQVGADKIVLSDVIDVNANNLGINLDNPAWAGKADVTNMAWNDATKTLSFNTQDGATNSVTFENMTESYANLDAFLKANSIL